MSGTSRDQVQTLLRFLTQDAKVPLAVALPKCTLLFTQGLTSSEEIAKCSVDVLKPIFADDKITKQVHSTAKRVSNPKKRPAPKDFQDSPGKVQKHETPQEQEREIEARLTLPHTSLSIDELRTKTLETNRAPLFLAFALTVAKYTLADLPLSSRLSLAQAATSAGAQAKAKSIGITNTTAEDEGWADGQPKVKLMGRQIAAMRRQVYPMASNEESSEDTLPEHPVSTRDAFWGIDLEALKRSNSPLVAGSMQGTGQLPIHRPETARNYLLKSVDIVLNDEHDRPSDLTYVKAEEVGVDTSPQGGYKASLSKIKHPTAAALRQRREEAAAMLLKCIDHVCQSWSEALSTDELDRRASSWYMQVRPQILEGKAGWGQKGYIKLKEILTLAKEPPN